jgi:hypothetical protein
MGNTLLTGIFPNLTVLLHHHIAPGECLPRNPRKRKRSCNRRCNCEFILEEIKQLSDQDFRKMFRMKRSSFYKLYSAIEPLLYAPNNLMACQSSGSCISKLTKLYCTLRWLAGGSLFVLPMVSHKVVFSPLVWRLELFGL